jgi:hypothetical protein
VIPDERPVIDHMHQVLHEQTREGWELVTAFPYEGAGLPGADPMVQSLSQVTSTLFIFKRLTSSRVSSPGLS